MVVIKIMPKATTSLPNTNNKEQEDEEKQKMDSKFLIDFLNVLASHFRNIFSKPTSRR